MDPPLDHKDVCIDTMGYRKKGISAFQKESARQQKRESEDQPATPGKRPTLLSTDEAPHRSRQRGLCQ